jgi:nucleotide-binding universal stress UspA family protein
VVVGVDGSQGSARALTWALHEARNRRAPVRVVTAWAWGGGSAGGARDAAGAVRQVRQTQEALVRAVLARFPGTLPQLSTELLQGDPASTLIDRSRDGVLLVLGSQGLSGADDVIVGSVADACLRHGSCPVVVVPADSRRGLPADATTAGSSTTGPSGTGAPGSGPSRSTSGTRVPAGRGMVRPGSRAGMAPVVLAALGLL